MPESPIRKLVPFAEEARLKGRHVFHLNIGQPDIKTPRNALEAIRNIDLDILAYSNSEGNLSYREGLAAYYQKAGIDVHTDNVIVTTGGSEALTFAINSIADPEDEIIIPEPFYANYNGFSISAGVNVVPVTARIEDDFALPPIEEFEALITEHTRAIMICNPGNPTGYLYTPEELEKLRELVLRHDLFLIADEVYREFAYGSEEHLSILNLAGLEDHAIVIDSVSKRYSMCGARVGCLVSRNSQLLTTVLKFAQARLSPPTLAQIAAEAALDTAPQYFNDVKAEYQHRRDVLVEGMNSIDGVLCPLPKGAFYAIAQLPVDNAERFAQWLLSTYQRDNKTVMVAPAEGFYATSGMGLDQVRLAYVLQEDDLRASIDILRHALQEYPATVYH